jgi:hypothetical protein
LTKFEKYSGIEIHENPTCGNQIPPCGQTDGGADMAKLIVPFCNFANGPNKVGKSFTSPIGSYGDISFFQIILKIN